MCDSASEVSENHKSSGNPPAETQKARYAIHFPSHLVSLIVFPTAETTAMSTTSKLINPALRAAANLRSSSMPEKVSKTAAAYLSAAPSGGAHTLPDLPYDYNALEPVISAETMTLHHTKHHNT